MSCKLVTETEGAPGLLKPGAREDARRKGLVDEPAIDHQVESRVRGGDLYGAEPPLPGGIVFGKRLFGRLDVSPMHREARRLGGIASLSEHEDDLLRSAGGQIDVDLKRRAGVSDVAECSIETPGREAGRSGWIALPAEKRRAVTGQAVRRSAGGKKRRAVAEFGIPAIARDQRPAFEIETADQMRSRRAGHRAKQPFGIICGCKPAAAVARIGQGQQRQLHRSIGRDEDGETLFEAFFVALPGRGAGTVADLAGRIAAGRQRGRRPDLGCFLVAQIERLGLRIDHRVVRPWREAMLAAVDGPAEAQSRFRDDGAKALIRQHVAPRRSV